MKRGDYLAPLSYEGKPDAVPAAWRAHQPSLSRAARAF